MAGATFSRLKNWTTEILTHNDLNQEIDNILNNLGPAGVDDYSTSVAQMRITTDPGESGSESLATSLAGEIERLRFAIKEIKGTGVSYWYQTASTSLSDLLNAVGNSVATNRITSGVMSSVSSQLLALVPHGTSASVTLSANATAPFTYYVNGTQYSLTASVTVTGLSAAPSTNNTALINDTAAVGGQATSWNGEFGTQIPIKTAGSELASRVGQYAAFSINNGSTTEYFMAYINSTSALTKAWRGAMFSSASVSFPKIPYSDGNTITLLRATWVFATTSGGLAVTYNAPTFSSTQPTSPATGDYWFDIANATWKTFNSVAWVSASAILVGVCMQTTTACIAARTMDAFTAFNEFNSMELEWASATQIRAANQFSGIAVGGYSLTYELKPLTWDITANLESGLSESAGQTYFAYVKENGDPILSDRAPSDMRGSRKGLYHPSEMWRCTGYLLNDFNGDLNSATLFSNNKVGDENFLQVTRLASFKNYADNAAFRVFQNSTPATVTNFTDGQYGPDQWYVLTQGSASTGTVGVARITETAAATQFALQLRQSHSATWQYGVVHPKEFGDVAPLRGKVVTVAFKARTDGTEVQNIRAGLVEWLGTADAFTKSMVATWASTPVLIGNATFSATTSTLPLTAVWRQQQFNATLSAAFNNLSLFIWTPAAEVQNDDFYLKEVQIIEGGVQAPWENVQIPANLDTEKLSRYFEKSYALDTPPATATMAIGAQMAVNSLGSAADIYQTIRFAVRKRATPTVTVYSPLGGTAGQATNTGGSAVTASVVSVAGQSQPGDSGAAVLFPSLTAGAGVSFHFVADSRMGL